MDWLGAATGLGAALSLALGGILMNQWRRPAPLLTFTAWQLAVGGIELAIIAVLVGDVPAVVSGKEMLGLAYLAIFSTSIAYRSGSIALPLPELRSRLYFFLLSPVVAFSLDALVRSLLPTSQQAIGAAIVLTSLFLGQLPARR